MSANELFLREEIKGVALQILILAALLFAIPVAVGGIFVGDCEGTKGILFRWVSGQMCLWAGFQLICVPFILKQKNFTEMLPPFGLYTAAMVLLAAGMDLKRAMKRQRGIVRRCRMEKKRIAALVYWIFFGVGLFYQLIQSVRLTYADGDDAFYIAISTVTHRADTMYLTHPYTGLGTVLDMRHALAPFPVWISFLAKVSGMHAVVVAKVVLPVVLICMTYAIFYLISIRLFPEHGEQRPLFMIFTQLLVLFGNYSIYTVENFMIARSRQGKAALGNIVIPFLLLLFLLLLQKLDAKEKIPGFLYLMFVAATMTGCLCSTLGALILCLVMGIVGILGSVCYKRIRILLPLAGCCIPCVCYAIIYLILG